MSEENFQPRQKGRRLADEELHRQVLEYGNRQLQIFQELAELSNAVKEIKFEFQLMEERHSHKNVTVLAEAIKTSQKELLAKLDINVDDPKDMDRLRTGIYFGQSMHKGVTTAAITILTAFCVGVGYSLWAITSSAFKGPN